MATSPALRRCGATLALLSPALLPARAAAQQPVDAAPHEPAPAQATPAEIAPPRPDNEPAWERAPRERRSGFTAGFATGVGIGSAAGYPNDVKKIGLERYYTETGVGLGSNGYLWIGGALTDWLTFGIAIGGGNLTAGGDVVSGGGFLFHIETFPLFSRGGRWRDVGVTLDAGAAGVTVTPEDDEGEKLIDGGAASLIGGGVFYEGIRFWKISTGPTLYGNYMWSATVRRPGAMLGWRMVVYTGP